MTIIKNSYKSQKPRTSVQQFFVSLASIVSWEVLINSKNTIVFPIPSRGKLNEK